MCDPGVLTFGFLLVFQSLCAVLESPCMIYGRVAQAIMELTMPNQTHPLQDRKDTVLHTKHRI